MDKGTSFIEPQYESAGIPILILSTVVLCYVIFIKFSIKNNKQNLMIICFIITVIFFLFGPRLLGGLVNVGDYVNKVTIEKNEKFLKKIQSDVTQETPYIIDFKTSEKRVTQLKTMYAVVLVKTIEGGITKDEVQLLMDVIKRKEFRKVNLSFYDKSKGNSVRIYLSFKDGITHCSPYYECENIGIKVDD